MKVLKYSLFWKASENGLIYLVNKLIANGISTMVNFQDDFGQTALMKGKIG